MSEWQPIETAPKDGTPVDGWCIHLTRPDEYPGWRHTGIWWEGGAWLTRPGRFSDYVWAVEDPANVIKVTHWMPLPDPPPLLSQEEAFQRAVKAGLFAGLVSKPEDTTI